MTILKFQKSRNTESMYVWMHACLFVGKHVWMYVWLFVCLYQACMSLHTYMYASIWWSVCLYQAGMNLYTDMYACSQSYRSLYDYMFVSMNVCIHVGMHAEGYACILVWKSDREGGIINMKTITLRTIMSQIWEFSATLNVKWKKSQNN